MNPGILDRAVTLLRPVRLQADDGEVTVTWQPVETVPAGARSMDRPSEQQSAAALRISDPHAFTIRYRADIEVNWQLTYQGRRFKLLNRPAEIHGRRNFLSLHAGLVDPEPETVTVSTPA